MVKCDRCCCAVATSMIAGLVVCGVAVFFVTDAIDKARYQTSVNVEANPKCQSKLAYDKWYYAIHDLDTIGKFEIGVMFHVDNVTQFSNARVVTGTMYMCQAHSGTFQPVSPTTCANAWQYNENTCDLVYTVSDCLEQLATTKTDLHLDFMQYGGNNDTVVVNFKSNFGGGIYELSRSTKPDMLTSCKAVSAVPSLTMDSGAGTTCPALVEKKWYYGSKGTIVGNFDVGLYLDGDTAYLCEAHEGKMQPVPATVCANPYTHDDSSCSLTITPSQCTQDLGHKKTDLQLTGAQRPGDGSIALAFTSHFPGCGGTYSLTTGAPPRMLSNCKLPSSSLIV